jgi:uncharacterized YccA/Bax inhibitor family protein
VKNKIHEDSKGNISSTRVSGLIVAAIFIVLAVGLFCWLFVDRPPGLAEQITILGLIGGKVVLLLGAGKFERK